VNFKVHIDDQQEGCHLDNNLLRGQLTIYFGDRANNG